MWVHSLSKRGKNMAFQRVGNMTLKMRRSCQWSQSCFWVEKFCKSGTEGTSKTVQISLVFRMKTFFFSVFSMFSILEASLRCWARYPREARSTLRSWVHVLSRCLKLLCLRRLRFGYVLSALFARLHLVFRAPAALHRTWLWSRVYTESTLNLLNLHNSNRFNDFATLWQAQVAAVTAVTAVPQTAGAQLRSKESGVLRGFEHGRTSWN